MVRKQSFYSFTSTNPLGPSVSALDGLNGFIAENGLKRADIITLEESLDGTCIILYYWSKEK